ncbi:MAG: hypothetical protein M1822_004808 [Bathelium mastoideum]|nr:MAG: hypothetical protein M1822_004808 [Bathelium mastoideum]
MSDSEDPLVDTTVALPLHSKRTQRVQRKLQRKIKKHAISDEPKVLLDLPSEILVDILGYLRPSNVFKLLRVNKALERLIKRNERAIAKDIVSRRYSVLIRCFPLPVPFDKVESDARPALLSDERQEILSIHRKPYQHIKPPDPRANCTCLTCILAWNNLCLLVDFARWQDNLDQREPIPMIPRGSNPEWNHDLVTASSIVVEKAMQSRLWYARIFEQHLDSTVRSIKRLCTGGKQDPPFQMSAEDAESQSDAFLNRKGPSSYEFPYHRDNYYMLKSYLPNRRWEKEERRWLYYPDSQHERDLEWIKRQATRNGGREKKSLGPDRTIRTTLNSSEQSDQDVLAGPHHCADAKSDAIAKASEHEEEMRSIALNK